MKAFLLAHPAGHSLSPLLHRAAFEYAGLEGEYTALDVLPENLKAALEGLKLPDILGCNLSLPHKEAALEHLDSVSSEAQAIGAVNTVVHRAGKLHGLNTDAPGFLAALEEEGYSPGGVAVVLGAGGAARAAVYALVGAGVEVWLHNRTFDRAKALQLELAPYGRTFREQRDIPWSEVNLLVNASSAGLNKPEESPLEDTALEDTALEDFPALAPGAQVYDMVYKPLQTRLVRDARAHGFKAQSGLGMLVHQARLAFLEWTGQEVPAAVMLEGVKDLFS
jgi:shikimate dehydrogenase